MILSTSNGDLLAPLGHKASIDLLVRAGFDAIDYSFCSDTVGLLEGQESFFADLKQYALDRGVCFRQAHAPFASSIKDNDEWNKKRFDEITRSMRYASILGIPTIIVHPCQHLTFVEEGVPERLFEYNMDFYRRLIPYCEEYGIRVALENMWQTIPNTQKIVVSTCGRPDEFVRYLDSLNNDCFTACLDIGHAVLCGENVAEFIRTLGKKRLGALHVHDVDGFHDSHTLPFLGVTDWESVMRALAQIGYTGDLTYETVSMLSRKPAELYEAWSTLAVQTGRFLISRFDAYAAKA